MQATKSVPAVERAFAILEALNNSSKNMNIAELSRKLSIPRSTAHVIALTLERCGYLTRDTSRRNCRLSTKTFGLGRKTIPSERLADISFKFMKSLSTITQLTSHLAILDHDQAVYVQKVPGPGPLHFDTHIGMRTNLHSTAIGKVLLAYAPKQYQNKFLSDKAFECHSPNSFIEASALSEELTKIAVQGYALHSYGKGSSLHYLAVPVVNERGELMAALSVAGAVIDPEKSWFPMWIEPLQRFTKQIGYQLSLNPMHQAGRHLPR